MNPCLSKISFFSKRADFFKIISLQSSPKEIIPFLLCTHGGGPIWKREFILGISAQKYLHTCRKLVLIPYVNHSNLFSLFLPTQFTTLLKDPPTCIVFKLNLQTKKTE